VLIGEQAGKGQVPRITKITAAAKYIPKDRAIIDSYLSTRLVFLNNF